MPIDKPLNLDGPATKAELSRIESEHESNVQVDATVDGIEAEVSTEKKGWQIGAFFKRKWSGAVSGGARIKKDF